MKTWWEKRKKDAGIAGLLGLMTLMLLAYNNCGLNPGSNKRNLNTGDSELTATPSTTEDEGAPQEEQPNENPVVMAEVDVGIKNFEEILETMSVQTGVPVSTGNNSIQSVFDGLKVQLPADNSIKSFLPAHQVAITKLAAEFCDRLVEDGTLRSGLWPNFNFGQNPNVAFSTANRQYLVDQALKRFMGPSAANLQLKAQVSAEVLSLFDPLILNETNNTATTRKVVKGVCITALASFQSIVL